MAQTYFPFDSGQGANTTEVQWQKMAKLWMETGVINGQLNELQAFADSTGMQIKVKSGQAWIEGHFFESDAEEVLPIGTSSSNPRIDRLIVRLDWIANTVQLAVIQGTPAVSPVAPAMTQNSGRWEIPLAKIRVEAGVNTILPDRVTDERLFVYSDIDISMPLGTGGQAISPNVLTKLSNLTWINRDRAYEWDIVNKKIVVKKAGTYLIDTHLHWVNGEAGKKAALQLFVNGNVWSTPLFSHSMVASDSRDGKGTVVRPFNAGDEIEFYIYHNMSNSGTVDISRITCTKLI